MSIVAGILQDLFICLKKQKILNFTYSDSVTRPVSDETHIFFGPSHS